MSSKPRLFANPVTEVRPKTRRINRRPAQGSVLVRSSHGDQTEARLHDFSAFGCNILSDEPWLRLGCFIAIRLDSERTVQGIVRWVRGGSCGVEFLRPLPYAEAEELAEQF